MYFILIYFSKKIAIQNNFFEIILPAIFLSYSLRSQDKKIEKKIYKII